MTGDRDDERKESDPPIRIANFLSPVLDPTCRLVAQYLEARVTPTEMRADTTFDDFRNGRVDLGFVCGLCYAELAYQPDCPVELLAAPVLLGDRYAGRPIYFSHVVVRRGRAGASLQDLRGCTWAYNEGFSHSGHNVVLSYLVERGESLSFFGRLIQSGSHLDSLRLVREGTADAAAIDSHVLDVLRHTHRALYADLRIVDTLGPSTAPPLVVAKRLGKNLTVRLRTALLAMHQDKAVALGLRAGCI